MRLPPLPPLPGLGPVLHVALDEGTGPTVVLLHGIASSSVTFQNVIPHLRDTHRLVAIDLLGFGESPMPQDIDYTLDDHADAAARTLRTLNLPGPIILVGHSMGGLIAPRLAVKRPQWFSHLVLVSPPIYLSPKELGDPLDRGVMDFYLKAYNYLRNNKEFTLQHAALVEKFLAIPKAMDINERTWIPFVRSLQNAIESQTTLSDLAAVSVPIDIVYGSLDEFHSRGTMRIVSRLTGVTVTQVLASDHLIGKRLAKQVAKAIASA